MNFTLYFLALSKGSSARITQLSRKTGRKWAHRNMEDATFLKDIKVKFVAASNELHIGTDGRWLLVVQQTILTISNPLS